MGLTHLEQLFCPQGLQKGLHTGSELAHRHGNIEFKEVGGNTVPLQRLRYGGDWTFEFLPDDHPVYHCYFDFDGAPSGLWEDSYELHEKVEGVTVDGRLLLAICQKAFIHVWGDPEYPQYRSERMIQFGINTVIFALTQEGSITHRVVDAVR